MKIIISVFFVFFMYSFSNAQCNCDICGGAGWITQPDPCYKCSTSGWQTCPSCSGYGTELCKQCSGSGKEIPHGDYVTCRSCGGSGKLVCSRCDGACVEYCSLCGGKGYEEREFPCEVCGRTGEIPCQ